VTVIDLLSERESLLKCTVQTQQPQATLVEGDIQIASVSIAAENESAYSGYGLSESHIQAKASATQCMESALLVSSPQLLLETIHHPDTGFVESTQQPAPALAETATDRKQSLRSLPYRLQNLWIDSKATAMQPTSSPRPTLQPEASAMQPMANSMQPTMSSGPTLPERIRDSPSPCSNFVKIPIDVASPESASKGEAVIPQPTSACSTLEGRMKTNRLHLLLKYRDVQSLPVNLANLQE